MDAGELERYIDQRRWLLSNGLVTDDVKNQLFMCGSIVHREIQAVELDIVPEQKLVKYRVYVGADLLDKIQLYHRLSKSNGIFAMWRFKRLLKKEGSLDFQAVLGKMVKDYCGPSWSVVAETLDFNTYVDGFEEQGEKAGEGQSDNKLSDQ